MSFTYVLGKANQCSFDHISLHHLITQLESFILHRDLIPLDGITPLNLDPTSTGLRLTFTHVLHLSSRLFSPVDIHLAFAQ
jgi:hypothetical protein